MSRIGDRKLTIPEKVNVEVLNDFITVKGPKGELTRKVPKNVIVNVKDNEVTVEIKNEKDKDAGVLQGTLNSHIQNMIEGVTEGYSKKLEIQGVGYRFQLQGNKLNINAGFSHQVKLDVPKGINAESPSNTELTISGIDKELVGEFAAVVRKVKEPEPYKGKGIRYVGEHIKIKEGKKASK
ncbi:MAG: 50S ribosomal protein L6 [Tenericutes bacterium]|jgi:large subunit ribosomal protein L6|nr:50S ribosomal protein L6 [Bacilli bacterium]MDD3995985.1 50S ribosomal protein L6 [Bacilli bacterium]MDD4623864.1 50S ribosomal protein L6 [Bacilli bacterium]MDD4831286.1 50S ribosomal protein L6 [Bacilli bacterium]NLV90395.1 50S ribosomal protein L6 [Mycoplasmatota bacterium]